MLVGAEIVEATVDDDGGMAVFVNPVDLKKRGGDWIAAGYAQLIRGEIASLLCRDIPPGEKRVIDLDKSVIVHVAPNGVPVVEFVETPRERLKRALKESENMVFPEQFRHITKECHVYLAATEEAAKKGGG